MTGGSSYSPPLDVGFASYVRELAEAGVETFESCEEGNGHAYAEAPIRLHGGRAEAFRALAEAIRRGLPVSDLRRVWPVVDGEPTGPYWN